MANYIKVFIIIIITELITFTARSQDSVTARITHISNNVVRYKINKMNFISVDCKCDSLKKGDVLKIPKSKFDSLLTGAKAVRRRDIKN